MRTLEEMIAARSPESQARITARTAEIRQKIALMAFREESDVSQAQPAKAMVLNSQRQKKTEQPDNDPTLNA